MHVNKSGPAGTLMAKFTDSERKCIRSPALKAVGPQLWAARWPGGEPPAVLWQPSPVPWAGRSLLLGEGPASAPRCSGQCVWPWDFCTRFVFVCPHLRQS